MGMIIRRFAGTFILISLLLAHYHSPNWLWFALTLEFLVAAAIGMVGGLRLANRISSGSLHRFFAWSIVALMF